MHEGKYVFSQLMSFVSKYEFSKCVKRYDGNYRVRSFNCWSQFLSMSFGQITHRESLRDIVTCLNAQKQKLYHLGITSRVARSTLADANETRDWRIYADFARTLIAEARALYSDEQEFGADIDHTIYAMDSTTIDLCLNVFPWARFRKRKGAVKLHALLDLQGSVPTFAHISDGLLHDVNVLDYLEFEAGAIYVLDRGYLDFQRLYRIRKASAYFVIRAQNNQALRRLYSRPKDLGLGVRFDQIVRLCSYAPRKKYPENLRCVKYFDSQNNRTFRFLTNNLDLPAETIALLYKYRWQIELFFKWIKQHLRIKVFWGQSANAVKTQIWIAIATYVLVAIVKKRCQIDRSIYEILQILSVSVFDRTPMNQLFQGADLQKPDIRPDNQLNFLDL